MTMSYVVIVNPRILSDAGMPVEGVLFATCLSSAIATLIMGIWANYPIALAPGMSLQLAYFTYSVVIGRGVPWQTALGVVFLFPGILFLLLTLTQAPRDSIVNGIPDCLKLTEPLVWLLAGYSSPSLDLLQRPDRRSQAEATMVGMGHVSDPGRSFSLPVDSSFHRHPHGPPHWQRHSSRHRRHHPRRHSPGPGALAGALFSLPHPSSTFLKLDLRFPPPKLAWAS